MCLGSVCTCMFSFLSIIILAFFIWWIVNILENNNSMYDMMK